MAEQRLSDHEVAAYAEHGDGVSVRALAREVAALRSREREAAALLRRCVESIEWPDTLAYMDRRTGLHRDLRAFLKEG